MGFNRKNNCWMRKLTFLLIILLIFPAASDGATQKFNFTVQKDTALNFENGSYIIEVVEISRIPLYVKVNLTSGGLSRINNLYDSETPITFNEIKLSASSITNTDAVITLEFPTGWSAPKRYQVTRPVLMPNIVLTKSVDKTNINIGDVVEFKITVENKGNATAYNLTLIEPLPPKGFTPAYGSVDEINAEFAVGAIKKYYYGLKAVESGTFKIEPTTASYGSKTSTSNSLAITVGEASLEKSNLTTVISLDKNNVHVGDSIKATVKITNTGNAQAKSVLIDGTPPLGMEVIEGDLRQVFDDIASSDSKEYRVTLKANEAGNYTLHLRTVYNDVPAGMASDSEPIIVTQNEQNYLYFLVPMVIIIAGIVLFTIKRHREYSY